ncbi:hypothetical protein FH608_022455 [Nonomuraea phyllanthi]|uniref:Uncharacterized protein n=1 Tax=Nonomuraea phyllanthi TaxID=2219224 RepID=A0A5C4WBQ9_9ACTN|nr:hypothetical protein [Nonomuraea phyllanthi]KAB8193092.1 hypothetical protein FH608_022455 [Nonomuraea phyllanthi]
MYAMIRQYAASPDAVAEMVQRVDEEFADRIPEQVGALLYAAVDTGEGTVMTITVFGDAEAAARAESTVAGSRGTSVSGSGSGRRSCTAGRWW